MHHKKSHVRYENVGHVCCENRGHRFPVKYPSSILVPHQIRTKSVRILHVPSVFQIEPVLPPEADKRTCGRTKLRSSHPAGRACSPEYAIFFNFSNRTIIKGDMATFVNQSQNPVFTLFHLNELYCNDVWVDRFSCGQTTFDSPPVG